MSDSLFGSLLNMLDKRTVGDISTALGQPEQSVSRGMETSIAALLGGLASKAEDTGTLRKTLDMVAGTPGGFSWSQIASSITDPNSSLMSTGKRLLPALFGSRETAVTGAISREAGLSSGTISTLLTMAAPLVIGHIGKLVTDGGMTMSGLSGLLQRESATIRAALPSSLSDLFWPGTAKIVDTASPVVAQAVQKERSFGWLPILATAVAGLGLFWFLGRGHTPRVDQIVPTTSTGTANRVAVPAVKVLCSPPSNVVLPEGSSAARLLEFAQNPDTKTTTAGWLTIDQMAFATGSAHLRSQAEPQLNNIAAILTNCPGVHLEVAGYTDSVGSSEANLRLSRNRARTVVAELISKGVPADHLTAEGYGEEYPQADNSTAEGRAQNRRVAMRITQK
jgi:OOP family OmpA-OmpF porin